MISRWANWEGGRVLSYTMAKWPSLYSGEICWFSPASHREWRRVSLFHQIPLCTAAVVPLLTHRSRGGRPESWRCDFSPLMELPASSPCQNAASDTLRSSGRAGLDTVRQNFHVLVCSLDKRYKGSMRMGVCIHQEAVKSLVLVHVQTIMLARSFWSWNWNL